MNELQKPNEEKLEAQTQTKKAVIVRHNPFSPETMEQLVRFADYLAKSDMCPKGDRGKPQNIIIKVIYGADVGLAPMQSVQNVCAINGIPALFANGISAVVKAHPDCEYTSNDFDEVTMTATYRIKRKGDPVVVQTFSKEDAVTAGLWTKDIYQKYPKDMLLRKAIKRASDIAFPDALQGFQMKEDVECWDNPPQKEFKDVTPIKSVDSIPIEVTQPHFKTAPGKTGMTEADYKKQEQEAAKVKTYDQPLDQDEDIPDLSKPEPKKEPQTPELSPHVELERELLRRVVDTSKFYKHYKISTITELTDEKAKEALKALKKKPLKETEHEQKNI